MDNIVLNIAKPDTKYSNRTQSVYIINVCNENELLLTKVRTMTVSTLIQTNKMCQNTHTHTCTIESVWTLKDFIEYLKKNTQHNGTHKHKPKAQTNNTKNWAKNILCAHKVLQIFEISKNEIKKNLKLSAIIRICTWSRLTHAHTDTQPIWKRTEAFVCVYACMYPCLWIEFLFISLEQSNDIIGHTLHYTHEFDKILK